MYIYLATWTLRARKFWISEEGALRAARAANSRLSWAFKGKAWRVGLGIGLIRLLGLIGAHKVHIGLSKERHVGLGLIGLVGLWV